MPAERLAWLLTAALAAGALPALAAERARGTDEAPSAELLEFLARFETSAGKPIDPLWFHEDAASLQQPSRPPGTSAAREPRPAKNPETTP